MKLRYALLCSAISAACVAPAGQTLAQTTSAAPAASSGPVLGEVVVTARRHSESLQKVPEAVAAFTQKALTEKSITNAFALNSSVPGLTVEADSGNPGLPSFAIRGRGQIFGTSAGSVETYFADIPLSAPFQEPVLPPQFFDVQSFQVLKGPQGTLFGRSTTGGAVVIVPQAPTDNFGGYVRIQGGTYNDFQFEGAVNLPLVPDVAMLRLAAFSAQRAGYMHTLAGTPNDVTGLPMGSQTYDNVNTDEFRGTLLLTPFAGFSNSTMFTYHYDKTRASSGSGLALNGLGQTVAEPGYETRYTGTAVDLEKPSNNVWALINTTTYDLTSNLTVKNIFGYINAQGYTDDASDSDGLANSAVNIDLLAVPQHPRKNYQTTDELQLQGKNFDNRFTWILGGLYDETIEPGAGELNITSETFAQGTGVGPGSTIVSRFEQNNITSWGVFGSGTVKLTDKLNLTAGYRHSWFTISYLDGCGTSTAPDYALVPNGGAACAPSAALTKLPTLVTGGDTYNVGLDYSPFEHFMIYGGYRHGYKHGGYNPSSPADTPAFAAENVDDFYVGVKNEFHVLDMPARVNVEGFYDLYNDYQAAYLGLVGANLVTITSNIPKSTFRGFDLDAQIEPTTWLSLSANYSYIDAFINKWSDGTVNLAVNPIAYVSPNKFSMTARFHKELDNDRGELVFAPTFNYQDRFYTTAFQVALPAASQIVFGNFNQIAHGGGEVPGYSTVDLRAEWNHFMGSKFDAALNVTNLTNKLYFLGNSGTLEYGVQGDAYGPPRMVSIDLSTRF